MNGLSRRDFLKSSSLMIAAVPAATLGLNNVQHADTIFETMGRAFEVTDIHDRPYLSSAVVGQLKPDSVIDITGTRDDWYQVDGGWVQRTALQPILPYRYPEISDTTGFWAELVAPVSAVKAWCAAHAPVVARLGFGAVVYVMDRMIDDAKQVWYGVTADSDSPLVGWVPALHYARWLPADPILAEPLIKIVTRQRQLVVHGRGTAIATARICSPPLQHGTTTISRVQPGAAIDASIPLGLPWLMNLGNGIPVYGAFWHNRFGEQGNKSSIELTTFAARWLYEHLPSSIKVVIE